ncbi:MAG: hypothetical protein ABI603_02565 [Acidobacteriota bacterium]
MTTWSGAVEADAAAAGAAETADAAGRFTAAIFDADVVEVEVLGAAVFAAAVFAAAVLGAAALGPPAFGAAGGGLVRPAAGVFAAALTVDGAFPAAFLSLAGASDAGGFGFCAERFFSDIQIMLPVRGGLVQ